MRKIRKRFIFLILIIVPLIYSFLTVNPKETSIKSEYYSVNDIEFIYDLSYMKKDKLIHEQNILDKQIQLINSAKEYILFDIFLFNDQYDKEKDNYPNSTEKLTQALIQKKKENPNIVIQFITDPINNFYGSYEQKYITQLRNAGIDVTITDLNKLKDSNPIYSGYWRIYISWFGTGMNSKNFIPNPADKTAPNVSVRSALKLVNFKGNHRKTLVTDQGSIVSTANPHDASGYHSNIAIIFKSELSNEIISSEKVVIEFSKNKFKNYLYIVDENKALSELKMRLITEKAIYNSYVENIEKMKKGDNITIGTFYLSDIDIIEKLLEASNRGVNIKIVLDPNNDAFGLKLNGIPNRPAVTQLVKNSNDKIQVRWYQTNGEQYHTKLSMFESLETGETTIILGSANLTRRNLKGYNLETNVEILSNNRNDFVLDVKEYFDRIWNNKNGTYTVEFSQYKDDSKFNYIKYLLQEKTGMCTY